MKLTGYMIPAPGPSGMCAAAAPPTHARRGGRVAAAAPAVLLCPHRIGRRTSDAGRSAAASGDRNNSHPWQVAEPLKLDQPRAAPRPVPPPPPRPRAAPPRQAITTHVAHQPAAHRGRDHVDRVGRGQRPKYLSPSERAT
jgi:hypothetical protein